MSPPSALPAASTTDLTSIALSKSLSTLPTTASSGAPCTAAATVTSTPALAELDASKLRATYTTSPKPYFQPQPHQWGTDDMCTDHMITARWTHTTGWGAPELKPYTRLDLWPTSSCLHYATECFEGLKVFRGHDGKLRVFRPSRNAARMLLSSTRIACPAFPPSELEKLILKLVATDCRKWLPDTEQGRGTFLYLRPTMIGIGRALGIQKPKEAILFIVMALFPRLSEKPMKLLASREDAVRAWPGGFGYAKVGANYGPSLLLHEEAHAQGYTQILWLLPSSSDPSQSLVTEAGASNFFCVLRSASTGRLELTTAPLDDKIILDGVTRRSILELARTHLSADLDVVERKYTISELTTAYDEGRFVEAFAAGTAYFVCGVQEVAWRGKRMELPIGREGDVTGRVRELVGGIMYGKVPHEWGVVVEEEGPDEEVVPDEEEVELMVQTIKDLKKERAWAAALERVRSEEEALARA